MNENHIPREPEKRSVPEGTGKGGYVFLGVALILVGLLWLLNNFGFIGPRLFDVVFSWQMLMVVIGGYLLSVKRYPAGAIVGGLGLLFLIVHAFDVHIDFIKVILPSIMIAVGISLLITRTAGKR